MNPFTAGTDLLHQKREKLRHGGREFTTLNATQMGNLHEVTTKLDAAEPHATGSARNVGRRLWQDRRGAVSAIFGVTAMAFFGVVGMATEAGTWYLAHRGGQNAADASAIAGAMTLVYKGNDTSTETVVRNTATRNGFTTGGLITVTANHPPATGAYASNNLAVEAIVSQTQTRTFSDIFGLGTKTVLNRAVAIIYSPGNACVLTLTGQLTINGNFTATAPNCMLASNYTGADAVNISNNPTVNVQSITSVTNCNGCTGNNVTTSSPPTSFGAPTKNPFEALNTATWPSFSGATCDNTSYGNGSSIGTSSAASPFPLYPTYSQAGNSATNKQGGTTNRAYCGGLKIQGSDFVDFKPGTYIFKDAGIDIVGGTITCSKCTATNGVHIIQTGSNASKSSISINGAAVNLAAGSLPPGPGCTTACGAPYSGMAGVLYYRDYALGNAGGDEVTINGNTTTVLTGGFYFPLADGKYNGNGSSTCTVIVGGSVGMTGTAVLNQTGCANIGPSGLQIQIVRLVE